jgi:type IV secretion system protein VirB2
MKETSRLRPALLRWTPVILSAVMPQLCQAQASPFQTGATAIQTNLLTIMTPVAVILVIALGIGAMVNRISWSWCFAAIAGIALSFGAPQIVTWIRGMFGV